MIAGQGTIGLELAEQVPEARDGRDPGRRRRARVRDRDRAAGAPAGRRAASSACQRRAQSAASRSPTGSRSSSPGELTTAILDELLDDVVDVADEEISEAIVLLLERTKLVVEGAGAVGVAALLAGKVGGDGPGRGRALRRQHRPDAADLGHAPRAHARAAATSSCARASPTGRASCQAARRWSRRSA